MPPEVKLETHWLVCLIREHIFRKKPNITALERTYLLSTANTRLMIQRVKQLHRVISVAFIEWRRNFIWWLVELCYLSLIKVPFWMSSKNVKKITRKCMQYQNMPETAKDIIWLGLYLQYLFGLSYYYQYSGHCQTSMMKLFLRK